MERVAPRQVLYENQLPLALESKSQRRIFYPEGASVYGDSGNARGNSNIIRIPINADSMLDVQHSYLQLKVKNKTGATAGYDFGQPIIKRLRIESAGTTLEDIDNYHHLYGSVLFPAQASMGAVKEGNLCQMGLESGAGTTTLATVDAFALPASATGAVAIAGADDPPTRAQVVGAFTTAQGVIDTAVDAAVRRVTDDIRTKLNGRLATNNGFNGNHELNNKHADDSERTYNFVLASGLLNLDKYLPLVMMNAGIVLELELGSGKDLGIGNGADTSYDVSEVRYIGHLIDLQRDFYDRLRMVMEGSGSVLQLTGTTFRNYTHSGTGLNSDADINIPARMKSIKAVFFKFHENSSQTKYTVGSALPNGLTEYQFRVGSVVYPPTAVKVSATNKGEAYQELRKAFGTLGDYQHGGFMIDDGTYYPGAGTTSSTSASPGAVLTPYALDFETFPKTALENGINSADRSLPITLHLKRTGGLLNYNSQVFVMCDAVWYVNLDGSVSVSI